MRAKRPRSAWLARLSMLVMALVLAVAGGQVALPGRSTGQAAAESRFAKYYIVDEADEKETLTTVAERIFGDDSRADELYTLNVNRVQPDGDVLKEADRLRTGWFLVLPWDAVGDQVRYGQLPDREGALPSPVALPSVDPTGGTGPRAATGNGAAAAEGGAPGWRWVVLAAVLVSLVAATGLWWWRRSVKR
ncbi:hypothetical protein [Micromonospora sp. DT233]|uniref:hypothetical protein n=1 Tax=Micromonospora sp. DT233 TaxID=3393432 RepID=UPI003CF963A0